VTERRGRGDKSFAYGAVALVVAAAAALPALGAAGCSSDPPAAASSGRICGLEVWHKPATRDAHVEIVGDWNGWQRPGTVPVLRDDGWSVASIDAPVGEHAYAIVEDGVWITDDQVPMTAFHDGQEVSLGIVDDCERPLVKVDGVDATPDGHAVVRASFVAGRAGSPVDPAALTATSREGIALAVSSADPKTGALRFETSGLKRGKYTFSIHAKDARGADTAETLATVWIEPHPWDPRDAIVYQVVLDRFRGDQGPLAPPKSPSDRAGGTLEGLRAALEAGEIEALGVNTLWLSPLYKNPDGEFPGSDGHMYTGYHGYWPVASQQLDERVASDAELDRFMQSAHARDVRVLFDVVPNHVHEQHAWVKDHPDWFNQDKTCVCGQGTCDWATHIKTCWFAPYLPDLDWTNIEAARAATSQVMWWFDRWDADGLRIDAVPMMPRAATRRIAHTVRARYEHPGNVPYILGENFTGPGAYQNLRYDLGPFGLDGSFHFPLMWTLRETLAAESAPMSDIDTSFRDGEQAWDGSGAVMGMIIGNHDVSRFASVSAGSDSGDAWTPAPQPVDPIVYAKQRVALATILTLPGAPVVYYGDELGLAGKNDPDSRRVMPAEAALIPAQIDTRTLVRKVGRARACSDALRRGALRTLVADAERFVFAREIEGDVANAVIVALSRRPALTADITLPSGAPKAFVDVTTGTKIDVTGGVLTVPADAFGVHVYVAAGGSCAAD
jgi:glycosidase